MAMTMRISALILSFAGSVLGHSHIDEIWAPNPSVHYQGWNPNYFDNVAYPDDTPGWVSILHTFHHNPLTTSTVHRESRW